MKWLPAVVLLLPAVLTPASSTASRVVAIELGGTITHATFELVREGLEYAESVGASAIVLLLDTPGGLWDATQRIVSLIEGSSIPFISYVPQGRSALSAGTFILLSSHVAAMAPLSLIGACQPRAFPTGEPIDDPKLVNALREFLVQRAEFYGRNRTAAEEFITQNRVMGAQEASRHGVVEFVAVSVEELLRAVDGAEVRVGAGRVTLRTEGFELTDYRPSARVMVLRFLSDPLIAQLLFTLGLWGIILAFLTVGYEGEVVGALLLILGLIGMGFHVDLLAILLLVLGVILVLLEVREPGLQILGPAGIVCMLLGSLLMLRMSPARWLVSPEWQALFATVIFALAAVNVTFAAALSYVLLKSEGEKPKVLRIVGETAVTIEELQPGRIGLVKFRGEYWRARSSKVVPPGQKVRITAMEGLTLIVEPVEGGQSA